MLGSRLTHKRYPFKCGFCGFVYEEIEEAEECELHCVTHALALAEGRENAVTNSD
jgi:hypothetical protein